MALLSRRISRHDLGAHAMDFDTHQAVCDVCHIAAVLFQPQLGGLTDEQKSETVGAELLR